MTYRRDRERKSRIGHGDIDWHRVSTQGTFPRAHSAKAAQHPLAGVTPPPKPHTSYTMPVSIVDESASLYWIET